MRTPPLIRTLEVVPRVSRIEGFHCIIQCHNHNIMDCLFAAQNALILPPNLQCACPNDLLGFNCTVVIEDRIGATIWSGTAFTGCDGDRIQLRHSNENAVGVSVTMEH